MRYVPGIKKQYSMVPEMTHLAKNLYNKGLYESRAHFFKTGRVLSYEELYAVCKTNENYSLLQAQAGQQVLKSVKSFKALNKLKKEGKYSTWY